jgi:mannose-6-phosphate isomerase-like protein (cupin superfamily)
MNDVKNHQEVTYVPAGTGTTYRPGADTMTVKVGTAETAGAYSVLEVRVAPLSGPPQMHRHVPHETFYVLEGDFAVQTLREGRVHTISAPIGTLVAVPGNVPHNYKNVGVTPGRFLATFAPAGMESFFAEMSAALATASGGSETRQQLGAIAERHGIVLVPVLEEPEVRTPTEERPSV